MGLALQRALWTGVGNTPSSRHARRLLRAGTCLKSARRSWSSSVSCLVVGASTPTSECSTLRSHHTPLPTAASTTVTPPNPVTAAFIVTAASPHRSALARTPWVCGLAQPPPPTRPGARALAPQTSMRLQAQCAGVRIRDTSTVCTDISSETKVSHARPRDTSTVCADISSETKVPHAHTCANSSV